MVSVGHWKFRDSGKGDCGSLESGFSLVEVLAVMFISLLMTTGTLQAYQYYKGQKLTLLTFDQMSLIADATDSYIKERGVFPADYSVLRIRFNRLPLNNPFDHPYSIRGDIHHVIVSGIISATAQINNHSRGNGVIRKADALGTYEYKRTGIGYNDFMMENIEDPSLKDWGAGVWPW